MMSLRIIAQELYRYDDLFSDCLYSYRRGYGVGDAIRKLRSIEDLGRRYVYKTDISNYFNSIDTEMLMKDLRKLLDDERLCDMFESLVSGDEVLFEGRIIHENRGAMAGTPVSPFLSNIYLTEIDRCFESAGCVYMRYADDILVIAESEDELMRLRGMLMTMIERKGLRINPDKEEFFSPGEPFDFLGFRITEDRVDLSDKAMRKIKDKIRHSSKDIRRWMLKKNAPVNGTVKALIRSYNRSFYSSDSHEHTWSRWYFPYLTTAERLKEIDAFFQEHIRYVATGRFSAKNHETMPYSLMKQLGYRPLVAEYYSYLENKNKD